MNRSLKYSSRQNESIEWVDEICLWNLSMKFVVEICWWNLSMKFVDEFCRWNLSMNFVNEIFRWNFSMKFFDEIFRWNLSMKSVNEICGRFKRCRPQRQSACPSACCRSRRRGWSRCRQRRGLARLWTKFDNITKRFEKFC